MLYEHLDYFFLFFFNFEANNLTRLNLSLLSLKHLAHPYKEAITLLSCRGGDQTCLNNSLAVLIGSNSELAKFKGSFNLE